jgi:hypothetical protein
MEYIEEDARRRYHRGSLQLPDVKRNRVESLENYVIGQEEISGFNTECEWAHRQRCPSRVIVGS